MLDFEIVATTSPVAVEGYVVRCWKCESNSTPNCRRGARAIPGCALCNAALQLVLLPGLVRLQTNLLERSAGASARTSRPIPHRSVDPARTHDSAADFVHQPHVLIVDYEEPIRSLAACYVEQLGYRVTTASGAEEALLLTEELTFDVVLTDTLMPKSTAASSAAASNPPTVPTSKS